MILTILVSISASIRITEFVYREGIAGKAEFFDTLQLTLRFAFSVTKLIHSTFSRNPPTCLIGVEGAHPIGTESRSVGLASLRL